MRYLTLSIAAIVGVTFINAPSPAYSAPKQYSLAVGSLGGTMGRLGAGISSAFNKKQTTDKMAVSPVKRLLKSLIRACVLSQNSGIPAITSMLPNHYMIPASRAEKILFSRKSPSKLRSLKKEPVPNIRVI